MPRIYYPFEWGLCYNNKYRIVGGMYMTKSAEDKIFRRNTVIVITVLFALSLIPLFLIGRYDHPSADDFSYGLLTAQTWTRTHSFTQVIQSAAEQARLTYGKWQGTFSAVFLMAFQPAIFGEKYYFLTPIILIMSLIAGTMLFLNVLLVEWMGSDRRSAMIISLLVSAVTVQFVYSPVEGFYWYNGGILYTFFYSLALVLFSIVLLMMKSKTLFPKILYLSLASGLAFIIGTGNYTTALTSTLILAFLLLVCILRNRKCLFPIITVFAFSLAGLLISAAAPGNAVRQAGIGKHPGALQAIMLSFAFGGYSIFNATTVPIIIMWIFLTPFLYLVAAKSKYKFSHPIRFALVSFCIYCAQATPPIYAMGVSLPERLIDIVYYSYYLLVLLNLLYFLGWLSRKNREKEKAINTRLSAVFAVLSKHRVKCSVAALVLFFCSTLGMCSITKGADGKPAVTRLPAGASAVISLATGEAKKYDTEARERIMVYKDLSHTDVEVRPFSVTPYVLFENDITADIHDWRNQNIAKFYGKKSIRLISDNSK